VSTLISNFSINFFIIKRADFESSTKRRVLLDMVYSTPLDLIETNNAFIKIALTRIALKKINADESL